MANHEVIGRRVVRDLTLLGTGFFHSTRTTLRGLTPAVPEASAGTKEASVWCLTANVNPFRGRSEEWPRRIPPVDFSPPDPTGDGKGLGFLSLRLRKDVRWMPSALRVASTPAHARCL